MPRGRRKKPESYEEELTLLNEQIADAAKKLQALKDKKKSRIRAEEKNKDADKWDQLKKSGVSVDDLLDYVDKQQ